MTTHRAGLQVLLETHQELAGQDGEQRLMAWLAQEIGSAAKRIGTGSAAPKQSEHAPATQEKQPSARRPPEPIAPVRDLTKLRADPLLTPEEAAQQLGRDKKTLANWRTRKIGPSFFRFGGRIHYRNSDIAAWIEASKQELGDDHGRE
jgi:predicted DNA-binding transcriptional regulator AlpA